MRPAAHRALRLGPVIANGCDIRNISSRAAATRAHRPAGDARRVLMVARLDPIKDQATLLRAFAVARLPGWQLQLVGEGPERLRLETLALELGLDPAAVFLGRRADIPELPRGVVRARPRLSPRASRNFYLEVSKPNFKHALHQFLHQGSSAKSAARNTKFSVLLFC